MRNDFINIIQKCICVDFILNTLINTNYQEYLDYLLTIKNENLRNIKIIIYLYESYHQDTINIENIHPLKLCNIDDDYHNILVEYNLNIVDSLEKLRKVSYNHLHQQILSSLITSYFNFISLIHCFEPTTLNASEYYVSPRDNTTYLSLLSLDGFNVIDNTPINPHNVTYEIIRTAALEAINLFFNFQLDDNTITEEHYEIFFKNNPENKFYQLFFNSKGKSFKIRIWYKNLKIFYLYQTTIDAAKITPSMTKEDAKLFSDTYLYDKLGDAYENVLYDESYLNVYSYMNIPESYNFKYSIIDSNSKINTPKSLYITVDTRYISVSELSFL